MKKILGIAMVGLLLLGFTAQAKATFVDNELYRVVYSVSKNVEYVTDLGSISTILGAANGTKLGGAFTTSSIFGNATDIQVAYFAKNGTTFGNANDKAWVSGGDTTVSRQFTGFASAMSSTGVTYSLIAGQSATGTNAYYTYLDSNGLKIGLFNGLLPATASVNGEMSLFSLLGGQTQDLYYYAGTFSGSLTGSVAKTFSLAADGSTVVGSPVPVPPALLLLGSGLLGLIGFRRKA